MVYFYWRQYLSGAVAVEAIKPLFAEVFAMPKSRSFGVSFFVTGMFEGLMSRGTIECSSANSTAAQIFRKRFRRFSIVRFRSSQKLLTDKPSTYSRFFGVKAGEVYIIDVAHKQHEFTPGAILVMEDGNDVDFVASP